ncbi:MAG: hypothetical protein Q9182_007278 [Xanthomendoza sp. 2 TL-2023]
MAIQISVAAIWGMGAGIFVVILTAIFVIYIHMRRKLEAPVNTPRRNPSQRRAHLSITDEDVLRMPGMRRPRPTPYNHPPGWAPISSRESIAKKSFTPNPADIDPVTGLPPWPVRIPRRLKKTQSSPAVQVPSATLSPIIERSTTNTATSPSLSTATNNDLGVKGPANTDLGLDVARHNDRPTLDSSPSAVLPKPLFHGQQRSFSHGTIMTKTHQTKMNGPLRGPSADLELQILQLARMPRSSSLCSQHPGEAPTIPVPALPIERSVRKEVQSKNRTMEMSPQRVSGMSLLSGDTSVLDEAASRAFSQAETDFTSINLTSPPGSQSTPIGLGISDGTNPKWNFSRTDRSASPLSASKARSIRLQLSQQQSFCASIHNSIPRSPSSGLSMSLLNQTSPNPKTAFNLAKSTREVPAQQRSKMPQSSATNVFQLIEDNKAKRASTSILQAVSGNQSSPLKNPWNDRPSSIATEDPIRWDPKTSMHPTKPSAMRKNPAQRHKRQSCVRISNIPVIIPSSNPYRLSGSLQPSISPLTSSLPSFSTDPISRLSIPTNPRPPSLSTFNPTLPKSIHPPSNALLQPSTENTPYSPTFSMIPLYAPPSPSTISSSPSTSPFPTPTRHPSTRRPAAHPNRRHAIFPPSSTHQPSGCWPPLLSSSITPQDPPTDPQPPSPLTFPAPAPLIPDTDPAAKNPSPQPQNFLFDFPNPPFTTISPPAPHQQPQPPTTPTPQRLRGPRPLPLPSRILKSSSSSPHQSRARSKSPRKSKQGIQELVALRRSIVELRRMNSEVCEGGKGRGHGRYLSLGGEGDGDGERERERG